MTTTRFQGKILHSFFGGYVGISPAADTWRFQKRRPSSRGIGMTMLAIGYAQHNVQDSWANMKKSYKVEEPKTKI
jgi:hypothetical protein